MRFLYSVFIITLWTLVLLCSYVLAGLQDSLSGGGGGGGLTKPTSAPPPPPVILPGTEDPDFRQPIKNVTVPVGREAILACSVTELGHYKVGWMRAEDQTILTLHTKVVTHNSRISVTHDNHRTWNLHIRQVKEADRGCYMCQINTNIMKKQIGCIDVHVPPDISDDETSSDITMQEGENATLVCRANGHPSPRISWKREDGQSIALRKGPRDKDIVKVDTYVGDTLQLAKLDRRQMGSYLCIASNDVPPAVSKRITLNINFAPVIKVPNQLIGAPPGNDVLLECYVEAFPNTVNYWMKNRNIMLLNSDKHVVEEEKNTFRVHLKLKLRNFSDDDSGTYTCVSSNSLGQADKNIRIYMLAVPTKPPQPTTEKPVITLPVTPSYEAPTTKVSKLRDLILTTFAAPLELDSSAVDDHDSRDDEPPREATANASRAGGERTTAGAAAGGMLAPLLALLVTVLSNSR